MRDAARAAAGEAGFSLIEVAVCVALLVAVCVAGLGLLPALAHGSQSGLLRDAAANVAQTAIDRVRAATAYYPPSGYQSDHAYALNASAAYDVSVRVHRAWCGTAQTATIVPMHVQLAYDGVSDALSVTVTYPRDPCTKTLNGSVALTTPLASSAFAPGSTVVTPIGDPSQQ